MIGVLLRDLSTLIKKCIVTITRRESNEGRPISGPHEVENIKTVYNKVGKPLLLIDNIESLEMWQLNVVNCMLNSMQILIRININLSPNSRYIGGQIMRQSWWRTFKSANALHFSRKTATTKKIEFVIFLEVTVLPWWKQFLPVSHFPVPTDICLGWGFCTLLYTIPAQTYKILVSTGTN